MKRLDPSKTSFARKLRKDQTDVEKLLWYRIRGNQLGVKFRRQHQIGPYIVDFVCIEKKIIIELDGGQHSDNANKINDEKRDQYLQQKGYRVIRFWNNEVLQNLENMLEMISREAFYPHPDPLP